jgi:serine/threonine protein kinase
MVNLILGDRYEVQRQLGKQTGRQTLLARDLRTQELVVVKRLSLGSDFEWQHLKLFEREAKTLQSLSHPAIPRYLDYLELDLPNNKGFALVQSYVEGKTLEEHLKAGRTFSEYEVKELAKSLLEILIYLHEQKPPVIHRDIKPSNILLTNRSGNSVGQVYLVDFGSVQTLAAQEGGTITVVGTYGYMPPEQFGGRTTPASDLYSLGATLIYLVTGLHPTELTQKDFRIQFQQLTNLDPTFVDWLEWMTEPSLDRRLASAQEALQVLEKPRRRNKPTRVVRQPSGSEVVLTKTDDFLEIILPAKGFGFGLLGGVSFGIPLLFWGLSFLERINSGRIGVYIVVGSLFVLVVMRILFTLFRQIRLRIDSHKISFTNDLFGLKWQRSRPIPRQDLSQLELAKEYLGHNSEGEIVWTNPRLIIRAAKHKHELVGQGLLTESELKWLAHELSAWLGLPITWV